MNNNVSLFRKVMAGGVVMVIILLMVLSGMIWQHVSANEIVVIQAPFSGNLTWHTTPGLKWQGFGMVTVYYKRNIYQFTDKVRFNDGGHADMIGSIQYEMPLDTEHLNRIQAQFGSQSAVDEQLIKTVVDKSAYMSGPLMSSKESYAEKRNALIFYVEDQARGGIYHTTQTETRSIDPLTGQEKTITVVTIVQKDGVPDRQETAVWPDFGIKPFNFSITNLAYDEQVEAQIKQQQQITMAVQTAMAQAKQAEQQVVTAAKEGEAKATTAKWEQEVLKAKAVTLAQQTKEVAETLATQNLNVAKLDAAAADQYRIGQLAKAAGDATYKREVMAADGALAQKLAAFVTINQAYASAIAQHQGPWVPLVVSGNGGNASSGSGAQELINLFTAQTAKQLSLNMSLPANSVLAPVAAEQK